MSPTRRRSSTTRSVAVVTSPGQPRTPAEVFKTPRSAWGSLLRTHRELARRRPTGFLVSNVWEWLTHYLSVVLRPRLPFRTYSAPATARPGIFVLPEQCVVGIAGDWGTGTPTAYRVGSQIASHSPDITIHL